MFELTTQCIHRDLKGENLLITSNERVKVTDFGFARIASRNAEEMRRMTYCGTDVRCDTYLDAVCKLTDRAT
jgi:serine/threonine protein kinase